MFPKFLFQLTFLSVAVSFLFLCLGSSHPHNAESRLLLHLGNETDRQALLAFKAGITSDPFGSLYSWNHSVHFCQWFGVTCGRRHQRVVNLTLNGLELVGSISPHIGNLSFLRQLWLQNNSLTQQIPQELSRLRRLRKISLRNNSITGEIPVSLSRCSNLVYLELSINRLEGKIPVEIIDSLSKLERLSVGKNNLIGSISSNVANLSSLRIFYASENNIGGHIPLLLGRLKRLEMFAVGMNMLAGNIPPSIFNATSIEVFVVQDNQLEGSLPPEIGGISWPRLSFLDVAVNMFTGTIPVSVSNASYLDLLDMGSNKLTGKVPSMVKLTRLTRLNFQFNYLGTAGRVNDMSFLSSLTNATNLEFLGLDDNNFGGTLPRSIGNFSTPNLRILFLDQNKFSGSIPEGIGNLMGLEDLIIWQQIHRLHSIIYWEA